MALQGKLIIAILQYFYQMFDPKKPFNARTEVYLINLINLVYRKNSSRTPGLIVILIEKRGDCRKFEVI